MRHLHAMPFGAEVQDAGGVRFRLWAPAAREVWLERRRGGSDWQAIAMRAQPDGLRLAKPRVARPPVA
jgi:maltooligosyltrehalose trehalohydrolase